MDKIITYHSFCQSTENETTTKNKGVVAVVVGLCLSFQESKTVFHVTFEPKVLWGQNNYIHLGTLLTTWASYYKLFWTHVISYFKKKKIKIKILRCENSYFLDSSLHAIPINVSAFKAIITHLFLIFDHLSIPALNLCHDPMSNNFLRDTWVHCWVSNYLITTTYAKFSISDI